MESEIEVAIFSYNRGKYLRNCVESVLANIPGAKITVYDDNSDDEETVDYLNMLGDTVVYSRNFNTSRHGNLYTNMQSALATAQAPFLLFLQDDTQVIRGVRSKDLTHIQAAFNDPAVAFLRPQLMKQSNYQRFANAMVADARNRLYNPTAEFMEGTFGNSYCDLVICDVAKLRKAGWQFAENERANQIQARSMFKYMPLMADGFVFYCPEVPSYRNRKLFLASKLVQDRLKGNISTYYVLTEDQNNKFTTRQLSDWPVAEIFLTPTNPKVVKPFVYQDYSKSNLLLLLYKLESRFYKIKLALCPAVNK